MKTKAQSPSVSAAIYTILLLFIAGVAFASDMKLNNNLEDLPPVIEFEEEEYIDDIPFDKASTVEACIMEETMNVAFDFQEEAYVDDIPFDTYQVVKNFKIERYLKHVFVFEEEEYIDDIPFDTEEIFNNVFFREYYARIEAKKANK